MQFQRLIETTYDAQTVDSNEQSAVIDAPSAWTVAYVTVASSASSPVGTAIQIQGSIDNANWVNLGSAVNVTGNGVFGVSIADAGYRYYRLSYTRSSGSYVATTSVLAKGYTV